MRTGAGMRCIRMLSSLLWEIGQDRQESPFGFSAGLFFLPDCVIFFNTIDEM